MIGLATVDGGLPSRLACEASRVITCHVHSTDNSPSMNRHCWSHISLLHARSLQQLTHHLSVSVLIPAGGVDDPSRGPLELWVADSDTGAARPLLKNLNTIFDE